MERWALSMAFLACALSCVERNDPPAASLQLNRALGGNSEGYLRAEVPRDFQFPEDHGAHAGFRNEWWYLTGNLETTGGRRFGYQLTLFRNAIASRQPSRSSRWGADHLWMGHFTVTDVEGNRFRAFERFEREAVALAGAKDNPWRIWVDDWQLEAENGAEPFPLTIRAEAEGLELELRLLSGKKPVLQGDRGLSLKSELPGSASYYYSMSRMPTEGRLLLEGQTFPVRGNSWMDREWSTSALAPNQIGWDWFSLQLDDGTEVMFYQLRLRDGSTDPRSSGVLIGPQGEPHPLSCEAVTIAPTKRWKSPHSKVTYPGGWRLTVPSHGLDLEVEPLIPDQELNLAVRYWEGAVRVGGVRSSKAIGGFGYVELTGYGEGNERGE